jgi:YggT family protein
MGNGPQTVKRAPETPRRLLYPQKPWNFGRLLTAGDACGPVTRPLPSLEFPCPTGHRMRALLWLIDTILAIYVWLLIAQAILSWLLAFGVINRYNQTVSVIGDFLYRITEPALRPIRSVLPNFGGLDISPVVLILIIYFLRILIAEDLAPFLYRLSY